MSHYMNRGTIAAWILGSAAAFSTAQSQAQTASVVTKPAGDVMEEIVVTARKREERLSEIPESISVLGKSAIENSGVSTLQDVGRLAPSFIQKPTQDPGTNIITVRGITQVRFGEPPVAIVVDGVQASSPDQGAQDLYDIERIEVLRGPQGATYGRNAIGGAINIITRPPTNAFENEITVGTAEGRTNEASGISSGPIIADKLLYRVTAAYRESDGLISNADVGGKVDSYHATTASAKLLFKASDSFRVDARGRFEDFDGGAAYFYPIFPGQDAEAVHPVIGNRKGVGQRYLRDFSVKADWDLAGATLTSISAYSAAKASTLRQDLDFLPWPIAPTFPGVTLDQTRDVKAWSEELRLASSGSGPLKWLSGVYYLRTHRDVDTQVFLDLGPGTVADGGPRLSYLPERNKNQAYAVFGSLDYALSDMWRLSAGLREDWDDRDQTNPVTGSRVQRKFSQLQPKLSLSRLLPGEQLVYISAGRGFRSGGFNAQTPLFPRQFDAETADTYEFGTKLNFFDRRGQLTAAAFYSNQRNVQIFQFDGKTGTQGILTIKKASHYGVEADGSMRLGGGFSLTAGGSVIKSRIGDYDGSGQFSGNKLPQVSGWQANVGVQFEHALGARWELTARADYSAFGDLYWFVDNLEKLGIAPTTNARVILKKNSWTITLFANNLFDYRYDTDFFSALYAGTPTDIGYPNAPRLAGLKIGKKF